MDTTLKRQPIQNIQKKRQHWPGVMEAAGSMGRAPGLPPEAAAYFNI